MDTKTDNEALSRIDYATENLHIVSVEMLDILKEIASTLKSMDNNIAKLVKLRPIP